MNADTLMSLVAQRQRELLEDAAARRRAPRRLRRRWRAAADE
jgi:hypothetical protein